MKEKSGSTIALGNLIVSDAQPPTVKTFGLRALPPGVAPTNVTLDAALRKRVIEGVNADLAEFYIDAGVARQMEDALGRVHTKRRASTMSANERKPRKRTSSFSNREKIRRKPLSLRNSRSISFRFL